MNVAFRGLTTIQIPNDRYCKKRILYYFFIMLMRRQLKWFFTLILVFLFTLGGMSQQPQLLLPVGHSTPVTGVCFSPDGKWLATNGGEEKNVKIWETRTGRLLKTINAHTDIITSVSFSNDGAWLLTTGHDQRARVWEVSSGNLYYDIYYELTNWVEKGFFSRDGKKILLVSGETMEYHDLISKKRIQNIFDTISVKYENGHKALYRIISSDLHPGGELAISANSDSSLKIWDLPANKVIRKIKEDDQEYHSCLFNAAGNRFLGHATHAVSIWETGSGKLLRSFIKNDRFIAAASFSPDGLRVLITHINKDKTAMVELWDIASGRLIQSFVPEKGIVIYSAMLSPDENRLLTLSMNGAVHLWNARTGKQVQQIATISAFLKQVQPLLEERDLQYIAAGFSRDAKHITAVCVDNIPRVYESVTGKPVTEFRGISSLIYLPRYSPDGSLLATAGFLENIRQDKKPEGTIHVFDLYSGKVLYNLNGHSGAINELKFSAGGRYLASVAQDSTARLWDLQAGKMVHVFGGHEMNVYRCHFSADERFLVTQTFSGKARIWNTETGNLVALVQHDSLDAQKFGVYTTTLSSTGRYLKTVFYDDYRVQFTETETGKTLFYKNSKLDDANRYLFDPREKYIIHLAKNSIELIDIRSGDSLLSIPLNANRGEMVLDSAGKRAAVSADDGSVGIWELPSGKLLGRIKPGDRKYNKMEFTRDDKYLLTNSYDNNIRVWDATTLQLLSSFPIGENDMFSFSILREGRQYVFTRSFEGILSVWDVQTGKKLTTAPDKFNSNLVYNIHPLKPQFIIDNKFSTEIFRIGSGAPDLKIVPAGASDFLVIDSASRYDGPESARKLLYFTCGTEIIELDQVKDLLWVPGLAKRVMNRETIHAPGIASLNICGLTPKVEEAESKSGRFEFRITPRRGGLGETVLYVNGIEAKRYKPGELKKNAAGYELLVRNEELQTFFIAGQENPVTVKAYTADNSISSRGAVVTSKEEKQPATSPSLYALMIGVSDYKGDELDLKYAAKDAADIANATGIAARKLLNTDGKEHVFIYNLNTSTKRDQLPEKNAVKKILEEIGKKATAGDVILIFFAGHGVMAGEADKKQFYFLTADASTLASTAAVKEVGISTAELTEWMKPQNIKAQKRILIFDACNSGQAIKDFVKMGGNDQQYLAARSDDKSQLVKAIDKLNEKSGMFILSASASDQSAYEMGRYSQGLLTYSLLKAIKQEPDILEEGKYLNVARWFNAAEKTVSELSKETGTRQEPQIVSTTNFNIGLVDEEVMATIVLPQEKPLFAASNFQNSDEAIADDDLELSKAVNLQLGEMATRGSDSKIVYVTATNSPDAWSLSGRYTVSGTVITAQVNVKQSKAIKHRFELRGTTDKLKELAAAITEKAIGMVK